LLAVEQKVMLYERLTGFDPTQTLAQNSCTTRKANKEAPQSPAGFCAWRCEPLAIHRTTGLADSY
jgi:hypothetical protein